MAANELWSYSLESYSREGVEPLLLELQDRFGADINIILACCWLAAEGRALSRDALAGAQKQTQAWRRECVQPLRSVRRYLKTAPGREAFRERVKALELEAEREQQRCLFEVLKDRPQAAVGSDFDSLAQAHLAIYCELAAGFGWVDVGERMLLLVGLLGSKK